jgi:type II secretion system (T2SS) protein M
MKNRLTRNWIAVGVIWAGALAMTYMNLQMIQQIKARQESIEFMHMDDIFLKNNFKKVTQVLKQRSTLHKPIESMSIELLSLENRLKALANKQGLTDFRLTSDQTGLQEDRIPLDINVVGTYKDLIFWLHTLETDTPFLLMTGINMAENRDGEGYLFQVETDFRFNITEDQKDSV